MSLGSLGELSSSETITGVVGTFKSAVNLLWEGTEFAAEVVVTCSASRVGEDLEKAFLACVEDDLIGLGFGSGGIAINCNSERVNCVVCGGGGDFALQLVCRVSVTVSLLERMVVVSETMDVPLALASVNFLFAAALTVAGRNASS